MEALKRALADDPGIAYALVFGSAARGTAHTHSDVDVAIGLSEGQRLTALELGDLVSRLEEAVGRSVDVVDLEVAPPGLAYRIFRDGKVLVEKDRARLVARRARAVLEYLDFKPVEEEFARGVLAAASRGR
jgi:predicted nucleotidyltransferase